MSEQDPSEIEFEFEVTEEEDLERLDTVLTGYLKEIADGGILPECDVVPSRSKVAQWISQGRVEVDYKKYTKAAFRPPSGAIISVCVPAAKSNPLEPDESVKINVVYEDDELLVIEKPAGLVVHPGAGTREKTLVHGLLAYLGPNIKQIGDTERPGIVHRLDKDTSGLMVVAKTELSYQGLVKQFVPPRTIIRKYRALTCSLPQGSATKSKSSLSGEIRFPIGRHPVHRKKMAVVKEGGRDAYTQWEVVESLAYGYMLELRIHTGRTHQIRVHLEWSGAAIVGDPVYGHNLGAAPKKARDAARAFGRQALHACSLSFLHPVSGRSMSFESTLPEDFQKLVRAFS